MIIEECKEVLHFVDLPDDEYASWLAQDAWKLLRRAESLSGTDAARAILCNIACVANYKSRARRSLGFRDIDAALESARAAVKKAESIPDDFVEKPEYAQKPEYSLESNTLALLSQARDIEAGTRRLLQGKSEKEYIKDLKEYMV